MSSKISRKNFLRASALVTGGAALSTKSILANPSSTKKASPSDIVNIALIGCGAQGPNVAKGFMGLNDVRCIAGCDVYELKRNQFQQTVKQSYSNQGVSTKDFTMYEHFEDLMENKDIDAVIIATPDHWHSLIGVAACQAGKDLFVEKPLAFSIYEGEQLSKAVRKYNRIMQTGSMQRSMETFEQLAKIGRSGVLGKINMVYAPVGDPPREIDYKEQPVPSGLNWDKWLGPLSTKYYYNEELCPTGNGWGGWRWYKGLGGGYTTDWGAHMFDCAQWAIGKDCNGPVKVIPPEESKYKSLTYVYDNGIELIQHYDPWDGNRGNSVKIIGEKGWIFASRSEYYCSNPEWSREGMDDSQMPGANADGPGGPGGGRDPFANMSEEEKKKIMEQMKSGNPSGSDETGGFVPGKGRDGNEVNQKHYRSFIDGIKTRIDPNTPVEIGQSSSVLCNIGNIAYDLKRTLDWNPLTNQFLNDDEANRHRIMKYEMRAPYNIDSI